MNKKTLFFDMDSSFIKIKDILSNKDFITLEIWAISDEYPNNNTSHFPLETMEKNVRDKAFYNKPILGKFNNYTDNYETHNFKKSYDPETQMEYYDYENGERPLGLIRESDNVRIEVDENGLHWIVFTAVVWVKYNFRGVKKLLRSKHSKVSVEVSVFESHIDENGIEVFDEWVFDGVTILGYKPNTKIQAKEGVNNARLSILDRLANDNFAADMRCLQFAYEEFDKNNQDIKEIDSHLYIEKFDKGGVEMALKDKEEIFEASENNENIVMEEENKPCVKEDNCADGTEPTKVEECEGEAEHKEECKVEDDKKEAFDDDDSNDSNDPDTSDDDNDDDDDTDDDTSDDDADNKEDDVSPESENIDENDKKCESVEDEDQEEVKKEDNCGNFEEEVNKEENCRNFEEDYNKLSVEFSALQSQYDSLQEENNNLKSKLEVMTQEKDGLMSKVQMFEKAEKDAKIEALAKKAVDMAKKEGFDEKTINSIKEKCEMESLATEEDVIKEIAYISYMNRSETIQRAEFSAKVSDNIPKNAKEEVKTSFDKLQKYINKN